MPNYRRARTHGGTFFFTVVTYNRFPVFETEAAVDLLGECFDLVARERPYGMVALVILPDHLHCIWTVPDDDSDFSTRWKRIKTTFTRAYSGGKSQEVSESMLKKGEKGVWQRRFWEHRIRDQEDLNRHCDYVHYNPVKHGLVTRPAEWKHSTLRRLVESGRYPEDWGGEIDNEVKAMDLE